MIVHQQRLLTLAEGLTKADAVVGAAALFHMIYIVEELRALAEAPRQETQPQAHLYFPFVVVLSNCLFIVSF